MDYGIYSNGHLKSGLQKLIRRGMADDAAATAVVLARRGLPLFKRLPLIAAEDVGWEFTSQVFNSCQEFSGHAGLFGKPQDDCLESVAKLVRTLARTPKDRDCIGLAGLGVLANEREHLTPDLQALRRAIEAKEEMLAMRHCERFAAGRQRRLVWDLMRLMSKDRGSTVECHIEGIRGESYQGVQSFDELILMAAGIFSLTGSKAERPFDWKSADGTILEPTDWLPWFCFDMHTKEGSEAKMALQREGVDIARLNNSWWFWESAVVDTEIGQLARRERIARGYDDESRAEWEGWRGQTRGQVEAAMRRNDLPTGP